MGAFGTLSLLACAAAHALGLGRLTVQSALGEPLRAEIEVTSITAAEESSLSLRVASPQVYRNAGIEFNEVLSAARLNLERRADGRVVVAVRADQPARDPFIDLIVEASWSAGRMVREYTLLMSPPAAAAASAGSSGVAAAPAVSSAAPPATALAPGQAPVSASAPAPEPAAVTSPVATPAHVAATAAEPAPVTAPAPASSPVPPSAQPPQSDVAAATPGPAAAPVPAPPPAPAPATVRAAKPVAAKQYVVRPGETLYRVATEHRPEGVSLDQMLVSLYRANPDAFMGQNMNRLKAGAVLKLPAASESPEVRASEARELIEAHSADFGAYRARLAAAVPNQAAEPAPSRQASGRVEARVKDRKTETAPAPDQLKLSQGGVKAASSPEASLSRSAAAREAAQREAELARNVAALRQLQQMGSPAAGSSSAASATVAAPPAVAASAAITVPTGAVAVTAPASGPASAPVVATAVASAASAANTASVASSAALAASAPASAAAPEPDVTSLQDRLMDSPWALPGAAALIVLLAALGGYRLVRSRRAAPPETSFQASRFEGTAFGSAGPDTQLAGGPFGREEPRLTGQDGPALSELSALGDVDPVAEADVYLAYGRDRQAEEILRDALRAAPERLDIQVKLLEVLALRREVAAFGPLARDLHTATGGQGPQWAQVASMGRTLDPDNPLYASALPDFDAVGQGLDDVTPPAPQPSLSSPTGLATEADPLDMAQAPASPDEPSFADALREAEAALGPAPPAVEAAEFALDLGDEKLPVAGSEAEPNQTWDDQPAEAPGSLPPELDLAEVDLTADDGLPPATPAAPVDEATEPPLEAAPLEPPADPLERKLALASEFLQIGDLDAARDLLDEVLAQADGPLKDRARELLEGLG